MIDPYLLLFTLSLFSNLVIIWFVTYYDNQKYKDFEKLLKYHYFSIKELIENKEVEIKPLISPPSNLTEPPLDKTIEENVTAPIGDDENKGSDLQSFDEMDDKQFEKVINNQLKDNGS